MMGDSQVDDMEDLEEQAETKSEEDWRETEAATGGRGRKRTWISRRSCGNQKKNKKSKEGTDHEEGKQKETNKVQVKERELKKPEDVNTNRNGHTAAQV